MIDLLKEHKYSLLLLGASALGACIGGKMFESEMHELDKKKTNYVQLQEVITVTNDTEFEEGKAYYIPYKEN